ATGIVFTVAGPMSSSTYIVSPYSGFFVEVLAHKHFFFQAEDGIRDRNVTGVQTCALPILKNGADDQSARTAARNAICGRWNRVCSMLLKMPSRAVEKYHIGPSVTERRICGVPVSRPSVSSI